MHDRRDLDRLLLPWDMENVLWKVLRKENFAARKRSILGFKHRFSTDFERQLRYGDMNACKSSWSLPLKITFVRLLGDEETSEEYDVDEPSGYEASTVWVEGRVKLDVVASDRGGVGGSVRQMSVVFAAEV